MSPLISATKTLNEIQSARIVAITEQGVCVSSPNWPNRVVSIPTKELGKGTQLHFGGEVIVKITSVTEKVQGSIRLVNQATAEDLDPLHLKSNNPLLHDEMENQNLKDRLENVQVQNEQLVKAQVQNEQREQAKVLERQQLANDLAMCRKELQEKV